MKTCERCGIQLAWEMGPRYCHQCALALSEPISTGHARIMQLERDLSAARAEAARWRSKYDEACAVLHDPDSTNDGGTDLADTLKVWTANYTRLESEAARLREREKTAFIEGYRWGNDEPAGEDECWAEYLKGTKSLETLMREERRE